KQICPRRSASAGRWESENRPKIRPWQGLSGNPYWPLAPCGRPRKPTSSARARLLEVLPGASIGRASTRGWGGGTVRAALLVARQRWIRERGESFRSAALLLPKC